MQWFSTTDCNSIPERCDTLQLHCNNFVTKCLNLNSYLLLTKDQVFCLFSLDRLTTSSSIGGASPSRSGFTLAQKVNIDYSPYYVRQWVTLTRYIENHRQHIFIVTLYTLMVIGAFIHKAYGKLTV